MKKVTGLGGIFFKSVDPEASKKWYQENLGIESGEYGAHFKWKDDENPEKTGYTAWNPFSDQTKYFEPGVQEFMVNYRVENLEKLMEDLLSRGVKQVGTIEYYPYGKFAWIVDCDGRKVELWEPVDKELGLE